MFNDPLQKRLYEMELNNPSENEHSVSSLRRLSDSIHFFIRYARRSIVEYTDELRRKEKWEKEKPGRDYLLLCRQAALCNPSPYASYARTPLNCKKLADMGIE